MSSIKPKALLTGACTSANPSIGRTVSAAPAIEEQFSTVEEANPLVMHRDARHRQRRR